MIPPSVQQSAISGALMGYGGMLLSAGHQVNPDAEPTFLANVQERAFDVISGLQTSIQALDAFQSAPEALQTALLAGAPMAGGLIAAGAASTAMVMIMRKCDFAEMWKSCTDAIKNLFRKEPAFSPYAEQADSGDPSMAADSAELYFVYDQTNGRFEEISASFYKEIEEISQASWAKPCLVSIRTTPAGGYSYQMRVGDEMSGGSLEIRDGRIDIRAVLAEKQLEHIEHHSQDHGHVSRPEQHDTFSMAT